jgi:hypothetical protein
VVGFPAIAVKVVVQLDELAGSLLVGERTQLGGVKLPHGEGLQVQETVPVGGIGNCGGTGVAFVTVAVHPVDL